jgi:hypothetical protein
MSLTDESVCVQKKRCPYRLKKKNCACADSSFEFVCSAFGLLTYGKLIDDINDEKGFKRFAKKLIKPIFAHIRKRSDRFAGLSDIVTNGLNATALIEKEKIQSIDRAADGFASMMKEIASFGLEGDKKLIGENCGYHIGRYIYIIDALDDLEQDEAGDNYNPFLARYGTAEETMRHKEEIAETLYDSLNAFSNYYALAAHEPLNGIDRIIFNITELGGRTAAMKIVERKTKNGKSI